jgi:3-dehydroquinate synthase
VRHEQRHACPARRPGLPDEDLVTDDKPQDLVVPVDAPGGSYAVHIGRGLLARAGELAGPLPGAERVAIVHAESLPGPAEAVAAGFAARGLEVHRFPVPAGEDAKRLDVVAGLYERFAAVPLHRADPVVAVGGGAVTDTAGFAAATWLRGVPLVNVPTTVLGMVDAAIGGKTGVDLPSGKNLVGAFHQPVAVLADLDTLATLPADERRAGLAEVVKAGLVADPALAEAAATRATAAIAGHPDALAPLVEGAVRIKAHVVAADEREGGLRAILNYGHTLGHALERLASYTGLRHGEAVSLGMVFAARVAEATGLAAPGLADDHVRLLRRVGLPVGGIEVDPDAAIDAMATDKKAQGGLRLVLLTAPGHPRVVAAPERALMADLIRSLAEDPAATGSASA